LKIGWKTWNRWPIRAWWRGWGIDPTRVFREANWVITRPETEVGRFVHVYPEGIYIEALRFIEKYSEFVGPEVLGGFVKPIRVDCRPRPYHGLINRAVAVLEECSDMSSSVISVVIL
jgi:hypothetical protein